MRKAFDIGILALVVLGLGHGLRAGDCLAHGVMTAPESRAVGSVNEDYQYCFGTPECTCGDFPDAGPLVATYEAGQIIQVTIEVTVSHESGTTFRFQLCTPDQISAECFAAGEFATAEFDLMTGTHTYEIELPADLTCDPCVLRWKWDYGFLSCADVRIVASGTPVGDSSWTALKSLYH